MINERLPDNTKVQENTDVITELDPYVLRQLEELEKKELISPLMVEVVRKTDPVNALRKLNGILISLLSFRKAREGLMLYSLELSAKQEAKENKIELSGDSDAETGLHESILSS